MAENFPIWGGKWTSKFMKLNGSQIGTTQRR